MVNILAYTFTGTMLGSFVMILIEDDLNAMIKLWLTIAVVCFVWVVDKICVFNLISVIGFMIGFAVSFGSIALCKAAKE